MSIYVGPMVKVKLPVISNTEIRMRCPKFDLDSGSQHAHSVDPLGPTKFCRICGAALEEKGFIIQCPLSVPALLSSLSAKTGMNEETFAWSQSQDGDDIFALFFSNFPRHPGIWHSETGVITTFVKMQELAFGRNHPDFDILISFLENNGFKVEFETVVFAED